MKLWDKGFETDKKIDQFTVGDDRNLDLVLAQYDVKASRAHARMLGRIGLLTGDEVAALEKELNHIAEIIRKGDFTIGEEFEDVHSRIEFLLTEKLGDTGK
jgi:argininosuccinate lyase